MDPISLIVLGTLGAIGYKLFKKEPEKPSADNNENSPPKEIKSSVLDFLDVIHPVKLSGNWVNGWALDMHTVSSTSDGNGHFNNNRSKVGEYLYQIKYCSDRTSIPKIGKILSDFIRGKYKHQTDNNYPFPILNGILCVPPSDTTRPFQPVMEIANEITSNIHIPMINGVLIKKKATRKTKGLSIEESKNELDGAFIIQNCDQLENKKILLFDDLYRSGTTLKEITKTILKESPTTEVYVLTITKTRTQSGMGHSNMSSSDGDIPF